MTSAWVARLLLIVFSLTSVVPFGFAQESGETTPESVETAPEEGVVAPAPNKMVRVGVVAVPQRNADAKAAKLLQALLRSSRE